MIGALIFSNRLEKQSHANGKNHFNTLTGVKQCMRNKWQALSPGVKGAIAGIITFIIVNLLLYFFTYGWFSYGIGLVGPFLGIAFGVMIAWCVKFANAPTKDNE